MEVALGLDLGNHNMRAALVLDGRAVAVSDAQGRTNHAAVVAFSGEDVMTGNDARPFLQVTPKAAVFGLRDLLGRTFYSGAVKHAQGVLPFELVAGPNESVRVRVDGVAHAPEDLTARLFAHIKELAQQFCGNKVDHVVLTVPEGFGEPQRLAIREALGKAGFLVLDLLDETTAALQASGLLGTDRTVIAFTCEMSASACHVHTIRVEAGVARVVGQASDPHLGGDDFDARIVQWVLKDLATRLDCDPQDDVEAMHRIRLACEDARNTLADQDSATISLSGFLRNKSGAPVQFTAELTQKEFNQQCMDMLQRMFKIFDEGLRNAGLGSSDVEHVVLVGGPVRVPLIRTGVARYFKRPPSTEVDPQYAVAFGAALHAQKLMALRTPSGRFPALRSAEHQVPGPAELVMRIQTLGDTLKRESAEATAAVDALGKELEAARANAAPLADVERLGERATRLVETADRLNRRSAAMAGLLRWAEELTLLQGQAAGLVDLAPRVPPALEPKLSALENTLKDEARTLQDALLRVA